MASSENLLAMEQPPWASFRTTFGDSWFSDVFAKETETLTKVLQKSLTNPASDDGFGHDMSTDTVESFLASPEWTPVQTLTPAAVAALVGGLGNEVPAVVKRRVEAPGTGGRISKRKSRASKRSAMTTFITADPANFRQMVQQVTGVRLNGSFPATEVVKPERQRDMNYMQGGSCLPTLDTSAFLLDQTGSSSVKPPVAAANIPPSPPSVAVADGGGSGFEFNSFSCFPTLESWKAI